MAEVSTDPLGVTHSSKMSGETRSMNKQSKKEALMAMISEELISSLIGDDEECFQSDDDDAIFHEFQEKLAKREAARKKLKRKKMLKKKKRMLEQQQQQQQDAVDTSHLHYAQVPGQRSAPDIIGDYQVELKDDDSFAGGCLEDLMPPSMRTSLGSVGSSYKPSESVTTTVTDRVSVSPTAIEGSVI